MSFKSCGQKIDSTQFFYKMATVGLLEFRTEPKTTRSRETIIPNITEKFREDRFTNVTCSPCCVDGQTDGQTDDGRQAMAIAPLDEVKVELKIIQILLLEMAQ